MARAVSETLQDRSREVESLLSLARVAVALSAFADGARLFQRALALAEAEFDQASVIAASEGLGEASLAQGQLSGAQAWLGRALRMAEAAGDRAALGRVRRRHQGDADRFPDARFAIEDRVVAEADAVVAECPQDRDDLIELYHADPSRIAVIPCGFDPAEMWPVDRIESRRASIEATAFLTPCVRPAQVFLPMHYATVNQLTDPVFDPYSKQPSYKFCAVRVRRMANWERSPTRNV